MNSQILYPNKVATYRTGNEDKVALVAKRLEDLKFIRLKKLLQKNKTLITLLQMYCIEKTKV